MKNLIITIAAIAIIAACNNSTSSHQKAGTEMKSDSIKNAAVYQCPMDCEKGKTYEKAGKCVVCGMELEEIK
ncbi:MAG: hypothetical protein H7296_09800 [Bacteroidia bacterium]|nr:hypothetical protein [Bacteroidia bacterium]